MPGQGHRAPPGVELPVHSGQLHGGLPVEQGADTGRRCTRGSGTRALNRGDPLHHTAGRQPAPLLETVEVALDDVAAAVDAPVEAGRPSAACAAVQSTEDLVYAFGNRVRDATSSQVGADLSRVVPPWSAIRWSGRVRGRPGPTLGTLTAPSTCSKRVQSLALPPDKTNPRGRPSPSQARWTFVLSPPRDRPRA